MAALETCLQDGGVSESLTYKMAALVFCLQDVGVSESLTYKMAACVFCLQDGGVSEGFYPQDGGVGVSPARWRRF